MKDLAYKILGMNVLWDEAVENDADSAFEYELQIALDASDLARQVADLPDNPVTAAHTRLGEIYEYARRREICPEHAIVELVNAALSHGLDKREFPSDVLYND